jgi:hypothetical protein
MCPYVGKQEEADDTKVLKAWRYGPADAGRPPAMAATHLPRRFATKHPFTAQVTVH